MATSVSHGKAFLRLPRGVQDEGTRALDPAREVRARVLDGLERADGPAGLHARLRVLHRQVEDALGGADHLGALRERAQPQGGAERVPAAALLAEDVPGRERDAGRTSPRRGRSPAIEAMGTSAMPGRVRSTWKSVTPADPRAATIRSSARSASATRSFVPSSAPPISPRSRNRAGLELAAVFEHGERADPAPQRHVGDDALAGRPFPSRAGGTSRPPRSRRTGWRGRRAPSPRPGARRRGWSRRCRRGRQGRAAPSSRARRASTTARRGPAAAARLRAAPRAGSGGRGSRGPRSAGVAGRRWGGSPSLGARRQRSLGSPRPRVATVVRRTSEVPPAMVWPRLVR